MKEYQVKTKAEAIALALELTDDLNVQQSAIKMWDFMPQYMMTETGSWASFMLAGKKGPKGYILFDEAAE
jgi:hypothetical protein